VIPGTVSTDADVVESAGVAQGDDVVADGVMVHGVRFSGDGRELGAFRCLIRRQGELVITSISI
jgi:hypothetical protein